MVGGALGGRSPAAWEEPGGVGGRSVSKRGLIISASVPAETVTYIRRLRGDERLREAAPDLEQLEQRAASSGRRAAGGEQRAASSGRRCCRASLRAQNINTSSHI
ncbi:hypothetical protein EYF80_065420 [Liparis tanakae]|uniref:Uncharacterized protein n=1 Tax=Liparis tanakae TaxID=230148 RepID=A0A4Z2E6A6_9TELE|nr:hypothetical protein EYF80_065420 [Liparis tanakae]